MRKIEKFVAFIDPSAVNCGLPHSFYETIFAMVIVSCRSHCQQHDRCQLGNGLCGKYSSEFGL